MMYQKEGELEYLKLRYSPRNSTTINSLLYMFTWYEAPRLHVESAAIRT